MTWMDTLNQWLAGDLSADARIWTALAPALFVIGYFIVGLMIYAIRYWSVGPFRDPEIESRGASMLANMWVRQYFAWVMQPVWAIVLRTGVPAHSITTLSVLLSTAAGVCLAVGRFTLGGWLYMFAGICDFFDGRLARARGSASASGAALDSVLDRYSDSAVLVGLAWFYRSSWVLLAVQAALVGSSLIPYIRAKGEASGVNMKMGLMQRTERIIYLGVAVAMSPILEVLINPNEPRPLHRLAVVGIVLLAVSTQLTSLQRLVYLLSELGEDLSPRWLKSGRGGVWRNLGAAGSATAFDFVMVNVLVVYTFLSPALSTACGCFIGAVVNFSMNRLWAFENTENKTFPQISRYGFVSLTSALLNSGGVAVLLLLPAIDYRIAWILVRIAVFVAWNFPLHRDYVFAAINPSTALQNK